MDYEKIYNSIISLAQSRVTLVNEYTEKHHIIPRCMGGSNGGNNIVSLLAKEHYMCHLLLTKIYPENNGLVLAFHMMLISSSYQHRITSRKYKFLKERHSEIMSINQTGALNSQFGTVWVYNISKECSKKIKKKDLDAYIKNGWCKGRKMKFTTSIVVRNCKGCSKEFNTVNAAIYCSKQCVKVAKAAISDKHIETMMKILTKLNMTCIIYDGEVISNKKFINDAIALGVPLNIIFKYLNVKSAGGNYDSVKRMNKVVDINN